MIQKDSFWLSAQQLFLEVLRELYANLGINTEWVGELHVRQNLTISWPHSFPLCVWLLFACLFVGFIFTSCRRQVLFLALCLSTHDGDLDLVQCQGLKWVSYMCNLTYRLSFQSPQINFLKSLEEMFPKLDCFNTHFQKN